MSASLPARLRERARRGAPDLPHPHRRAAEPVQHPQPAAERHARPRTEDADKGVVERVNEKRAAEGRMLLPTRVTPHTLRRTFASLCFFAGRDLRWVMGQLGHDDPRMTLAVYAQCMKRNRIDQELVWS